MAALDGAVALVTGASSGIGEATARALAAEGAKVAVSARRRERLERLAEEMEGSGGGALVLESDVSDESQAVEAVERTVDELGRLDVLVNNAGVMLLGPAAEAPVEEWDRMVDVNVKGLLHTTHAALGHLLRTAEDSPRGVADLVNISSVAGRYPGAGAAVYNLTKFGVSAFSEAIRQEIGRQGVRVTAIEPGAVSTELADQNRPEIRESINRRFEDIENLSPEDVADTIAFCVTRPRHVALNEILIRPTQQR